MENPLKPTEFTLSYKPSKKAANTRGNPSPNKFKIPNSNSPSLQALQFLGPGPVHPFLSQDAWQGVHNNFDSSLNDS